MDPNIAMTLMQIFQGDSIVMITQRIFVMSLLLMRVLFFQGETTDYCAIIEHLSVSHMKPVAMQRWLQCLCLCVSDFSKNHNKLVDCTLVGRLFFL